MTRSLLLSNNNMLLAFDFRGQVQDLYFPYVGLENHMRRPNVHRIGVYVEGKVSWLDEPQWDVHVESEQTTFVGLVTATNRSLGVKLESCDVVYNEKNIFIRSFSVTNMSDEKRTIKLFFGHEFKLSESMAADTAYFDPRSRTVIHYKRRRAVLINAFTHAGQFEEYTIGEFNKHDRDGSFRDADDGELANNPIEHGQVDSVVAVTLEIDGASQKDVYYWMCVGESVSEVHDLNTYVVSKNPAHLINTTKDYWYAWAHRYDFHLYGLSEGAVDLFRRSLFLVRGAADERGSILASADSSMLQKGKDTYAYMWPRDGAYAAMALDRIGDFSTSARFFEFCTKALSDEGYLMHKFSPDGALGSSWHPWMRNGQPRLPIQEDETALTLIALLKHYHNTHNLEFIEDRYNSFIKRAATFLFEYRGENKLPYPSYDLWEEKYGTHTYTAAAVSEALNAASEFARILGKEESARKWSHAAREIKEAITEHLFDEEVGVFYKMIETTENGDTVVDRTIDISSLFGVAMFNILEPDDPRLEQATQTTRNALELKTPIGGIRRYQNDMYYHEHPDVPGNSWILTTLWFAQVEIIRAQSEKDLDGVKKTLEWCVERALPSGALPEQVEPHSGDPLSATPLTWSHAEYITTVVRYLDKLEELGICDHCIPVRRQV